MKELRHRGEPLVAYPGAELWKAVGDRAGVSMLIKDLCGLHNRTLAWVATYHNRPKMREMKISARC
jgi:hypothetical protein